ncbi:MAG: hypothetical protein MUF54_14990, partial [Polyangiaceae bacterium]|nr:hypothetical protein [Polyangiaceae bacterium]
GHRQSVRRNATVSINGLGEVCPVCGDLVVGPRISRQARKQGRRMRQGRSRSKVDLRQAGYDFEAEAGG